MNKRRHSKKNAREGRRRSKGITHEMVQEGGNATLLKTTIPGLQLWLDGRDINGDGTANPASVSTWKDKSGLGNHATLSTIFAYSAVPTSTADGVLLNSGGQTSQAYYTKLSELPTAESAFFLVTFTGNKAGHNTFLSGTFYNTGRDWRRVGSSTYWHSPGGTVSIGGSTVPFPMNTRVLAEEIYSNGTLKLYIDGELANSASISNNSTSTQGSLIGATQGYGNFLHGTIHEIIVFNRAVTDIEREQVEVYLGRKWGLADSIPALKTASAAVFRTASSATLQGASSASFQRDSRASFDGASRSSFEGASRSAFEAASAPTFQRASAATFQGASRASFDGASRASFEGASRSVFEAASGSSYQTASGNTASTAIFQGASAATFQGASTATYEAASRASYQKDSAAQNIRDSAAQKIRDSAAQNIYDSAAQRIRDSSAQYQEDSGSSFLGAEKLSGANYIAASKAHYQQDSRANYQQDSAAQNIFDSAAQNIFDSAAQNIRDSAAQKIRDSAAQNIYDSAAQNIRDSSAQYQEDSGSSFLGAEKLSGANYIAASKAHYQQDSRANYQQDSAAQNMRDSAAQNIYDSAAQNIRDSSAQRIRDSAAQNIYDSAAQNMRDSAAQNIYDSAAQNIRDSSAQRIRDSAAQNIYDSAAQNIFDSAAQNIFDSAAQNIRDSSAQRIRDSAAQNIYDSAAQNIRDSSAQYQEDSGSSFLGAEKLSGANYIAASKAHYQQDSRANYQEDSAAQNIRDSAAQNIFDSAAQNIRDSSAQRIRDSAAQNIYDSSAQLIRDSAAQNIYDSAAQNTRDSSAHLAKDSSAQSVRDSSAQYVGDSGAQYMNDSGAQYTEESGAHLAKDSGSSYLNASTAFVSGAMVFSNLGDYPQKGRFILPKRTPTTKSGMRAKICGNQETRIEKGDDQKQKKGAPATTDDITVLTNGYKGRYVRIRPPFYEGDGFMAISQILIYDIIGLNITCNATVYATSSIEGTKPATVTINGNSSIGQIPDLWHSATPNRDKEYIELDLGDTYEIYAVRVLGTKSCPFGNPKCHERLDHMRVEIRADGDPEITQDAIDTYQTQILDKQAALAHAFIVKSLDNQPCGIQQLNLRPQPEFGNDPVNGFFTLPTRDFDQTLKIDEFMGRYVRVRPSLTAGDGFINLSQVIVYDVLGQNVSEGKGTYATSSISGTKSSSVIVDGSTDVRTIPDVWHSNTRARDKEFIEIDLGANFTIIAIRVIGRKGCPLPNMCENRMLGLRIEISDTTTPEAKKAYYSRPPEKNKDISGHNIDVRSLWNNACSIKLRRRAPGPRDPSIPDGFKKKWNNSCRRYEYIDMNGGVVQNPSPPRMRNPAKVFQVLTTDIEILVDKTITRPWTKYFDTIHRKYYYYNTSTLEDTWDHPYSPRNPGKGEVIYGDDGLPKMWHKYVDSATETYFYYNPSTGESTWDHPDPPPYPDGLLSISQKYLPLYEMYRDPKGIFFFNTLTTETFWTLPIGVREE
jgi:hypothetical protein